MCTSRTPRSSYVQHEERLGVIFLERFAKIYLEITNVCNLACNFCPPTRRAPAFLPEESFSHILDQIKPYTSHINLHVKGEPLLHPELGRFLDISYEKGFQVNITTNGTLIRRMRDQLLGKPALRQVNFSLHSFDGNNGGMSREQYIGGILDFTKEALKHPKLLIAFRFWNLSGKTDDDQDRRNDELLSAIEKAFDLPYRIRDEVRSDRGIKIADRVYLNQAHLFEWPDLGAPEYTGSGFCHALRNQAGILVDGTVVPCCLDSEGIMNLGNIHTAAFGDIIESPRAKAVFDGFSRKEAVEELCRKCGYRQRFS